MTAQDKAVALSDKDSFKQCDFKALFTDTRHAYEADRFDKWRGIILCTKKQGHEGMHGLHISKYDDSSFNPKAALEAREAQEQGAMKRIKEAIETNIAKAERFLEDGPYKDASIDTQRWVLAVIKSEIDGDSNSSTTPSASET